MGVTFAGHHNNINLVYVVPHLPCDPTPDAIGVNAIAKLTSLFEEFLKRDSKVSR